jgi:hypothetical protein
MLLIYIHAWSDVKQNIKGTWGTNGSGEQKKDLIYRISHSIVKIEEKEKKYFESLLRCGGHRDDFGESLEIFKSIGPSLWISFFVGGIRSMQTRHHPMIQNCFQRL